MSTAYRGMFPVTFVGGELGSWRVESCTAVVGTALPSVECLDVRTAIDASPPGRWSLRGVAGHVRYVESREKPELDARSPKLGRDSAVCAALIPIRKSQAWWALPQDERRAIFEARSRHISDTIKYLPRIARRLYHARDLGEEFDFLTWFEFAPEDGGAFDELLALLRSREEWTYVEHEVELRLRRDG